MNASPKGVRSELRGIGAVHDLGDFRNTFARNQTDGVAITSAHQEFGSAIHPVMKTHPVSGRRFLFVNEGFTQHLIGLKATGSNKPLDYLYHQISQLENQVRFQWTTHAMAIWDNRCTNHYATADYFPQQRIMHRITVVNDARVNDR
jgi:taurine dioxygenase